MPVSRRGAATTVAAALLLLAGSTLGSYAANGGPLLLGKSNTATKTTKLKTTGNGAALSLKSKAGEAPLKISNSTKITKLNADLVDGVGAAELGTVSYTYTLGGSAPTSEIYMTFPLSNLPPGRYLANWNATVSTSGGSAMGCFFFRSTGAADAEARVLALGTNDLGDRWVASGSGLLDTTATSYHFTCTASTASPWTVTSAGHPSQVVLTRVDTVSPSTVIGTASNAPRSGRP